MIILFIMVPASNSVYDRELSNSRLSGPIPEGILKLSKLEELCGFCADILINFSFFHCYYRDLGSNQLDGGLEVVMQMKSLSSM